MKDWVCAPNWLIMTAERRASNGLKATYPKTEGLQAVQKPKKVQKSQKSLTVPFHEIFF